MPARAEAGGLQRRRRAAPPARRRPRRRRILEVADELGQASARPERRRANLRPVTWSRWRAGLSARGAAAGGVLDPLAREPLGGGALDAARRRAARGRRGHRPARRLELGLRPRRAGLVAGGPGVAQGGEARGREVGEAGHRPRRAAPERLDDLVVGARHQPEALRPGRRGLVGAVQLQRAAGVLQARQAGRGEPPHDVRRELVVRRPRDRVGEDRHAAGRLQQRQVVALEVVVAGGEVVRRHGGDRVHAELDHPARQPQRVAGARAPDVRDDLGPSGRRLQRDLAHPRDLVVVEQRALAGGAAGQHAVEAPVEQPAQVRGERLGVHLARGVERREDGGEHRRAQRRAGAPLRGGRLSGPRAHAAVPRSRRPPSRAARPGPPAGPSAGSCRPARAPTRG